MKQKYIPKVNDKQFEGMTLGNLKIYVKNHYNTNFKGKSVVNGHKNIVISFRSDGVRHVIYARNAGYVKLKAIVALDQMIKHAVFCNWKYGTTTDLKQGIIGFLHFKAKINIENKDHMFRLVICLDKNGVFFYDHCVRVYK